MGRADARRRRLPGHQRRRRREHMPNEPFAIDDAEGFNRRERRHRDLWHRFYQDQMQINGGKNDRFVAWADSGGLVMGHYDGSTLPLWSVAKKYVLADNFFQGAFGGSFLNHFALACACAPKYPNAATSPGEAHDLGGRRRRHDAE